MGTPKDFPSSVYPLAELGDPAGVLVWAWTLVTESASLASGRVGDRRLQSVLH
jgi:hypothetical protein